MERTYDLSDLQDHDYKALARDLLNRTQNMKLELYKETASDIDLVQKHSTGQVFVAAQVKKNIGSTSKDIEKLVFSIKNEMTLFRPSTFIIVNFSKLTRKALKKLNELIPKSEDTHFLYFDDEWIKDQLDNSSDIADKYKFSIDFEYYKNKNRDVLESKEFYFQKASDVLYELQVYKERPLIRKDRVDDSLSPQNIVSKPYERLEELWKIRGEIKPSEFISFLEQKEPDLIVLYQLIIQFFSYVDTTSWNRQVLNEYDDKRSITNKTGVNQTDLVSHFIEYAINGFKILTHRTQSAFSRIIQYLENPISKFNIVSDRHRTMISEFFLREIYYADNFHENLRGYFDQYEIRAVNPENLTYFYSRIIYDKEIRKQWDPKGEVDSNGDESQTEKIYTIKTSLDNDGAYTTKDLLDIENDVRSFALVLASKDIKPPMAIALFGKWGSGKSFFIEHLIRRVDELSLNQGFLEEVEDTSVEEEKTEKEDFCKGIAQIKFNAWSYLDANLWAGLASSIFEKLDEYISNRSKGDCEKLKLRNHLSEKLEILSFERENIKQEKGSLEGEKNNLLGKLDKLKSQKDEIIKNVAEKNLSDIVQEVIDKINIEENTRIQLQKYGITQERIKELSPDELYKETKSWKSFFKNLFKLPVAYIITFILALIVIVIVTIDPYEIVSKIIDEVSRYITIFISIVGPIFAKIYSSVSIFKRIIKPITDYKNKFNKELEEAKFAYNRELELLVLNIKNKQAEVEQTESLIKNINAQISELEYTLNNFIAKRAFNNFVKRKIGTNGYEAHLGLISIIRKDFETLSDLFREIQVDYTASEEIIKEQLEKQKTHEEIVGLFKDEKALDRIVLYIDDLDRCSDEIVLEVIQAVHLLMAFPLFNVVVGVDKRCVNNALIYKNLLQYSKFASLDKIENIGIHVISPSEYLEKIFQIPFQLDDPNDDQLKGMVNTFLKPQIQEEIKDQIEEKIDLLEETVQFKEELKVFEEKEDIKMAFVLEATEPEESKQKAITPENLKLTTDELDLLKEIVWLVGSIPRTVKRFLNIYRIIRAHQDLECDSNNKNDDFLAIMFILAINIGEHKEHAEKLMKTIELNENVKLSDILTHPELNIGCQDLIKIRNRIESTGTIKGLLEFSASDLAQHIPFVGRFSFGTVENNVNHIKKK